jgi:hypothetical protein
MIATTELTTRPLQFSESVPDTHSEYLLQLCDRIGTIADRARAIVQQRAEAPAGFYEIDLNLLHLQARLETLMSRLQGTMPLLDSLDYAPAAVH